VNKRVCIVGATGYTGAELCSILARHEGVSIAAVFSTQNGSGTRFPDLHPALAGADGPQVRPFTLDALLDAGADTVFLATPETASAGLAPSLLGAGIRVIDLSGAFRLETASDYARWYGFDHPHEPLLAEACYGLTEWNRPGIRDARLIANPGCYPTAALLALRPLASRLAPGQPVVCDAVSGVSGAGRRSDPAYSFAELSGNFRAYNVGRHRHEPEILRHAGLPPSTPFTFVAHLLPAVRGLHATIHVTFREAMTGPDLASLFRTAYDGAPLVGILPEGEMPELRQVVGTPRASIGFVMLDSGRRAVVVSAIDNLLKGAASQAVQNFNLSSGFDEREGLSW